MPTLQVGKRGPPAASSHRGYPAQDLSLNGRSGEGRDPDFLTGCATFLGAYSQAAGQGVREAQHGGIWEGSTAQQQGD